MHGYNLLIWGNFWTVPSWMENLTMFFWATRPWLLRSWRWSAAQFAIDTGRVLTMHPCHASAANCLWVAIPASTTSKRCSLDLGKSWNTAATARFTTVSKSHSTHQPDSYPRNEDYSCNCCNDVGFDGFSCPMMKPFPQQIHSHLGSPAGNSRAINS